MAAALAVPEISVFWEGALAVNEGKLIHGKMIQLLIENKVCAVQRLHRNLGRPATTALVEILEARGVSSLGCDTAVSCLPQIPEAQSSCTSLRQGDL